MRGGVEIEFLLHVLSDFLVFFYFLFYTLGVLGLAKLLLVTWFSSLSLSLDRSSFFKNLLLPSSFIRCFSTLPPTLKKRKKKSFLDSAKLENELSPRKRP